MFVAAHRHHGLTAICRTLDVNVASVRSALARPVTARQLADEALKPMIRQLWEDNYRVYGARKIRAALRREHGLVVDRARVTRLMRELDIRGATRSKSTVTTRPDKSSPRAPDLVKRAFRADRPNELWVCDFTYVPTWSGFVYVAFITDVYSRYIVGWRAAASMTTPLVTEALDMAVWNRRTRLLTGLIAHSDAGAQYTSIAYTERLAEIGARPSIGTVADSYDNALAETTNGLYKAECVYGPDTTGWADVNELEHATLDWVYWFNEQRLHSHCGHVPPAEFEAAFYAAQQADPVGVGNQ